MSAAQASRIVIVLAAAAALGGCALSGGFPKDSTENFSVAKYGPAAARVVSYGDEIPKGGGHYMVGQPYKIAGKTYVPREDVNYSQVGEASWYGFDFHGRETANGEIYDLDAVTAAHPTMPLPSYARVTNLENGRSITVRVNDRGPFAQNRIIDVSRTVARVLDFEDAGTAKVRVEYVGPAPLEGDDARTLLASYREGGVSPGPTTVTGAPILVAAKPAAVEPIVRPVATAFGGGNAAGPRSAPATMPNDPLAPLILRTGFASGYAAEPVRTPAQEAADALVRSDLSGQLAIAAAKKATELGLRGGVTP